MCYVSPLVAHHNHTFTVLSNIQSLPSIADELHCDVVQLSYAVRCSGGELMDQEMTKDTVVGACQLLHASVNVSPGGVVNIVGNGNQVRRASKKARDLDKLSELSLTRSDFEGVLQQAFSHLVLAHYRNQLLHLFLNEALFAASLQGTDSISSGEPCTEIGSSLLHTSSISP